MGTKITSMSSGAIDPITQTKRVFWRPVTSTTVLKVGQPVCYNSDSVQDHKERTADPTHIGLTIHTYAAGAQDYTGRLFIVEEPLTANLDQFAGICKSLGPKAGADGDMIEIFTPVEGAMVPVYTDENCTEERTILGIRTGEASVSYPGRPIGIAQETYDRSGGTIDGMVWMKFRNFEYLATNAAGDATANSLIIDDEAGANAVCIKSMNLKFTGTGQARGLFYAADINGAGHANYGMFKFRTYISAAMSQTVHNISSDLVIKSSGTLTDAGEWTSSALRVSVQTNGAETPNLSGGSLAAIYINYYVTETGGAPANAYVFHLNTDMTKGKWDGLFRMQAGSVGDSAMTGDHAFDTADRCIPVDVAGVTYYIPLMNNKGD